MWKGCGLFRRIWRGGGGDMFIDHIHAPLPQEFLFSRGGAVPQVKGGIIHRQNNGIFRRSGGRCWGVSRGRILSHEKFNNAPRLSGDGAWAVHDAVKGGNCDSALT